MELKARASKQGQRLGEEIGIQDGVRDWRACLGQEFHLEDAPRSEASPRSKVGARCMGVWRPAHEHAAGA